MKSKRRPNPKPPTHDSEEKFRDNEFTGSTLLSHGRSDDRNPNPPDRNRLNCTYNNNNNNNNNNNEFI